MIKYLENENDFEKEISKEFLLVDFYADWCGPCKMMGEVLERISDCDILKVNVDQYGNIAKDYKVMSIPTLIIFKEGKEVNKNIGFLSEEELRKWINNSKENN